MHDNYGPGLSAPAKTNGRTNPLAYVVGAAFLIIVALVYVYGHAQLLAVPAMATTHAMAMVGIYATTGALLLTYARASGEVGYLVAAGTFFFVAGIMLIFSATYPNAIVVSDPPTILWGGKDSAVALFHLWQLGVIIGLPIATTIIGRDYRRGRPPGLGHGTLVMSIAVVGAVVGAALLVGPFARVLPSLVNGIEATDVSKAFFWLEMLLALIGCVVVGAEARHAAPIARWMFVVMVVTWGGAVASLSADRYSLGWYYNRVVGLIAAFILLILLIRDIGKVERQSLSLLGRDRLTGAASRESVMDTLERLLRRCSNQGVPLSVLWIDIDGFQGINERWGEQVGDTVLVEVSDRVQSLLGPDGVLGRAGGDDFIAVIPGLDRESTTHLAGRVLQAIREPHSAESVDVVTVSIGIAGGTVPGPGDSQLVREAMIALHTARQGAGDAYRWYTEEHGTAAAEWSRLRLELGRAIRDDEFEVEFQPIIDLHDETVAGTEALVRWRHNGQVVPASSFIQFATQSGMIAGIGRRVLEQLEAIGPDILAKLPPPFFLTFNLSVLELADPDTVERLTRGRLRAHASRLTVEVTEEFELSRFAGAATHLTALRDAGYGIALDDFGSGFSNLSRITQLHPAVIKVDRSLVAQAGLGVQGGSVTFSAAVDIARALGATVLAEGVETPAEREACRRLNVDLVQGYLYARSLDQEELIAFSRGHGSNATHLLRV